MITLNELDLEKSFQKLKKNLRESLNEIDNSKAGSYAYCVGRLEGAIKLHIIECTTETMKCIQDYLAADPNDLKQVNI